MVRTKQDVLIVVSISFISNKFNSFTKATWIFLRGENSQEKNDLLKHVISSFKGYSLDRTLTESICGIYVF